MPGITAKAVAFANNDYVHIAWDFGPDALANCGGFAVYRVAQGGDGKGEPVPAFARDADGNRMNISCEDQPIRKYNWRDVFAKRGGTFKYRVVPMQGPHQAIAGIQPPETEFVTLTPHVGNAQVFFNRGILSTQHTADAIWDPAHKKPDFKKLTEAISDPNNPLRQSLSGQHFPALTQLLDRAEKDGGSCWASLFELTDEALIDKLAACKDLHLILSNNNGDGTPPVYDGQNHDAAQKLAATAKEVIRRYMPTGQIGHNKFVVYKDAGGTPKAVLTGSTNWTATGICTQSNNAIVIEDSTLAELYLAYWDALKADAELAGIPAIAAAMSKIQGAVLRGDCAKKRPLVEFDDGSSIQVWFSCNTKGLAGKVPKGATAPPVPVDLAEVYTAIENAKQSVLFLAFMPGKARSDNSAHFLKKLAEVSAAKPALFVRGAVSDPDLTREFDMTILRTGANEDAMISSPQGIFKNFKAWRQEIYKFGHAIIHDKVIVIDPFSKKDCVLVAGSHNLGFRASSNNDENMLIIRGNPGIAQAYAMHVMDVFEHYRSRWIAANNKESDYDPNTDPKWQERYFQANKPAFAERLFWLSNGAPLPPLEANLKLALGLAKEEKAQADRDKAAADRKAAKAPGKPLAAKKTAAKKAVTKKAVAKKKVSAKKVSAKKVVAKKAVARKKVTKKAIAKKVVAKKKVAKKAVAKKAVAKKRTPKS